jgi:DNA-directed RNA polymerase subunit RPC12/RpoP
VAGLVIGTPQYMAPELVVSGVASGAADQYALAATVYEAVCDRLPFDAPTLAVLAVQHATQPPPPPHEVAAGVPAAFSAALLRGLHKEPAGRFPDCRSLAQALLAPLQALPPSYPSAVKEASGVVHSMPAVPAGTAEYTCPSCSTVFRLPPQPEGKQLRCRSCGTTFKVPPALGGAHAETNAVASGKVETVAPVPAVPSGGGQERFACPHCSAALRLPAEKRGRSMRCPRCQKTFVAGGIDRRSEVPAIIAAGPAVPLPKRKGAKARLVVWTLGSAALLAALVGSLLWLFLRALSSPTGLQDGQREQDLFQARKAAAQHENNLKQLVLAMHNYNDTYNQLPSATVYGKESKRPLYSWRVELLPFIEEVQLYQQFNRDEPWNSPNNIKLLPKMPKVFRLPGDPPDSTQTPYQVFVGQGPWTNEPGGLPLRFPASFVDGTSNTILIAEAANKVPWTSPSDLELKPNFDPRPLVGSKAFPGVFYVGMADGSVKKVPLTIGVKTLLNAINPADGDLLGSDWPQ